VTILSRSPDKIEAAALRASEHKGGKCIGIAQDVRDHDGVGAAFAKSVEAHGEIDILVSGAAGNFVAPFNGHFLQRLPRCDRYRPRRPVQRDAPGLPSSAQARSAACITISAPQAIHPYPLQSHVNAAKAGADMLVRTLAVEWGPMGVRVNAIIPGPIADTEGMARLAPTPEAMEKSARGTPLQRLGTKDEVADLALFLASDAAAYVTGAIMPCDGGMSLLGVGRVG
jgi:NAD(P)-dependent dehydrogenase (short-subunit alcohol dehydrogenase family)